MDPSIALKSYFMPQGISADLIATKYGFSRDDVDAYAVESQKRAAASLGRRPLQEVGGAGQGRQRPHASSPRTSTCGPTTDDAVAGAAQSVVRADGRDGGFDAVAIQRIRRSRRSTTSTRRQFVGHRRRRGGRADRQQGRRAKAAGLKPRARIRPSPTSAPSRRSC
jgi:acetyl-CoA C-acetyltransferase